jgi:alkaline phosphatase D
MSRATATRLAAVLLAAATLGAHGPVEFTHGIASGDVTPFSAVLWTRVDHSGPLRVEVSTQSDFRGPRIMRTVNAKAASDFTVKSVVGPLMPDQRYYYRFRSGSSVSETGTFVTAPFPLKSESVRFGWSGDSDGTPVDGVPFYNEFEVFDAARADGLDFFVYHGDTIYSDSGLRPDGPALTLDEYRDAYKANRDIAALPNFLATTSIYSMWDDHEVQNDYDGQTVDPVRYANGRQAFIEYMPTLDLPVPPDRTCADTPRFQVFHWGSDVDVIVIDERSCRSADVEAECLGDLGPTLPPTLRPAFGLPPNPPPGCLEAIFDPGRTMLGPVQKALFKAALRHSRATFKFVIGGLPMQQYWALPYDRWEGYGAERNEILNFIRDNGIENVVFLATDNHGNFSNELFVDLFTDPAPVATEFVTGPIATNTLQVSILAGFGPEGLAAFNALLSLATVDCRDLDAYAYGVVEVDGGTATVTFKDDTGATIQDQLSDGECVRTVGP